MSSLLGRGGGDERRVPEPSREQGGGAWGWLPAKVKPARIAGQLQVLLDMRHRRGLWESPGCWWFSVTGCLCLALPPPACPSWLLSLCVHTQGERRVDLHVPHALKAGAIRDKRLFLSSNGVCPFLCPTEPVPLGKDGSFLQRERRFNGLLGLEGGTPQTWAALDMLAQEGGHSALQDEGEGDICKGMSLVEGLSIQG